MKRIFTFLFAIVIVLGLTMQAEAALYLRGTDTLGNQLIYDSDINITWYDYMHPDVSWQNQVDWADALEVTLGSNTYSNWRLPLTAQPDSSCDNQYDPGGSLPLQGSGFNCIGCEMGHLYYTELGNSAGGPLSKTFIDGLTGETESFLSLAEYYMISGTLYAPNPDVYTWGFSFINGTQNTHYKDFAGNYLPALAVLTGDVTAVPEPSTFLLLGAGLLGVGLILVIRNKKRFKK